MTADPFASDAPTAEEDRIRIDDLSRQAFDILAEAIQTQVLDADREVAGQVVLFSGGKDSTVLAHLFRHQATHAAHANTGIGIEATRVFVRDTCRDWGLPLLEKHPAPGQTYRDIVLGRYRAANGRQPWPGGFPGPAAHFMMYRMLKERALRQVRAELVRNPRRERVVFLTGVRTQESARRLMTTTAAGAVRREGSVVWVSPLIGWSALDLNAYRRVFPDTPLNEVSANLHMSGECLCGAFAHHGELDEIADWYPEMAQEIRDLEAEVQALGIGDDAHCQWGWDKNRDREKPSRVGPLCTTCESRFLETDHAH
jgi:3'-phosphoadenosine 5'-phosphosulfate sulfotransferase (PAPS reductase)/FAD synthetase